MSYAKMKSFAFGSALSCIALLLGGAAAADTTLTITETGPAETVFAWNSMRCEQWDVPDSAARAWRDGQNRVHLMASYLVNRAMVRPDLDHVRPDCRVVFKGGEQGAPERYDDR